MTKLASTKAEGRHPQLVGWKMPLVIALAVACSTDPIPRLLGPDERLAVLSAPATNDTVLARPAQPLVVHVRDETGAPLPNVTVRFAATRADSAPLLWSMSLAPIGSQRFSSFVAAQTDRDGNAAALLEFSFIAGRGQVEVTVPEFAGRTLVTFLVLPGRLAGVKIFPKDTFVYQGSSFTFRGSTVDQFGNRRGDPVVFASSAAPVGAGAAQAGGQFTATGPFGQVSVRIIAGQYLDETSVSIAPHGVMAAYDQRVGGLVELETDGSHRHELGRFPLGVGLDPAWAPDGREIAFSYQHGIALLGSDGTISSLVNRTPAFAEAFWPAYSPDGRYVYFSADTPGDPAIWRVRRDGSGLESITHGVYDSRPSLDPTGRLVVYETTGSSEPVIRIADVQTGAQFGNEFAGQNPEWSPTGELIAFLDQGALSVVAPDGTGLRRISATGVTYDQQPLTWSPDGAWIALRHGTIELVHIPTGFRLPLPFAEDLQYPIWKPTP